MNNTNSNSYRNLIAWQRAKELVVQIYNITDHFPKSELYVLTSQMKRASISVVSNIVEGNQRRWEKDRLRFFNISQGSLVELGCQLDVAFELNFVSEIDFKKTLEILNKTGYLLMRLMQTKYNPNTLPNPSNRSNPN